MQIVRIKDYRDYKIPDSEVVKRVLSGEKELYEILLRRNNQKLFRVIRAYLKETQEIEDIMQNTYLKAYEKLYQFKSKSTFSTWLIRIGINEALARLNAKKRYFAVHDANDTNKTILEISANKQSNPEQTAINQETKLMIEKAIDTLDTKHRVVYIMREIEGMSISEIADSLELSPSNVKVRLHRAKGKLKENLYKLYSPQELFEFGFSKCDRLVAFVLYKIF